jgi:hypothetical protein
MFLKASAIAVGCPVALMSFDDAGAVPASPSLLKQPSLVIEIAGGRGPGWRRGPGAVAGAIGVPGADVAGSGQRLGAPAVFAVGNRGQNGKIPRRGIFVVRPWRERGFPCAASRGRSSVFPRGRPANLLAAINSTTRAFRSYISSKARPQEAARFAANRNAKTMSRAWRPWRLFLVLAAH